MLPGKPVQLAPATWSPVALGRKRARLYQRDDPARGPLAFTSPLQALGLHPSLGQGLRPGLLGLS